ncbi:MAG: hypothetical protein OXH29_00795 [bacterium]|nr:hypothetical protein [bacterium]
MSDERGQMTPEELDELASAYLDGEATTEEAALVEGDARLEALVEELRAVRDLIATPVEAPSQEVQDEMIAQALAHRAPVVSLETARRRLRAIPPRARVILAAAAVVAALALVGVTVFQGQGDEEFADDGTTSAPAMADEPAMDMMESAPASDEEIEVTADEVPMDDSAPASGLAASAEEAMEEPIDLMEPEEAAEDLAMDADDAPDEVLTEAPSDDSGDAEQAMADEPTAPQPVSEESFSEFATEADLVAYVVQLADERLAVGDTAGTDDAAAINLMGCELLPDEDVELLSRFYAVVEGAESQVSVYLGEDELRFTQTTPPPDCELFNSHTFLDWP